MQPLLVIPLLLLPLMGPSSAPEPPGPATTKFPPNLLVANVLVVNQGCGSVQLISPSNETLEFDIGMPRGCPDHNFILSLGRCSIMANLTSFKEKEFHVGNVTIPLPEISVYPYRFDTNYLKLLQQRCGFSLFTRVRVETADLNGTAVPDTNSTSPPFYFAHFIVTATNKMEDANCTYFDVRFPMTYDFYNREHPTAAACPYGPGTTVVVGQRPYEHGVGDLKERAVYFAIFMLLFVALLSGIYYMWA